jgi:hypothetical protein
MSLQPENRFVVEVSAQDEIVCRPPSGPEQRIKVADLGSVFFQTGADPFEIDWWLLNDAKGELAVSFPLGATGEEAALNRLRQLRAFKVDGMSSIVSGRFLCWEAPAA